MQRDDNEFMDLPENIKLDENEYILCEFKLVNTIHKEAGTFLCIFFICKQQKLWHWGLLACYVDMLYGFIFYFFVSKHKNQKSKKTLCDK